MPRWALTICLILLLGTASGKRGGSSKSGGSKSGSKSGSSGSSYPKQQWTNPNNRDNQGSSKTPSAPPAPGYPNQYPSNPGYPNKNPGQPGYPAYPNNNAPPPYSSQGNPYAAPPAYSAPGHHYPSPPGYPAGHSVPGYPNYPGVPVQPGSVNPGKMGKSGIGGIGTHLGAAAVGAVAGAAIAHNLGGPRLKIHHHHHGGQYHDGYSSSEEYFRPYITGPNGGSRGGAYGGLNLKEMSPEELQIVQLAHTMIGMCEKMRQPSVCILLKMHGFRPFTHPNSMFRNPDKTQNATHLEDNHIVPMGPGAPSLNGTVASERRELLPIIQQEASTLTGITLNVTSPPTTTHLSEDRLKAAEDLFKVLD